MIDKLSNIIKQDDIIAYAVRYGNSGALQLGTVLEVEEHRVKVIGFGNTKAGWLCYSDRIVVLPDVNKLEQELKTYKKLYSDACWAEDTRRSW